MATPATSADTVQTVVATDTQTTTDQPERVFSQSILISAVRCTLTYVVFPFIFPIVGVTSGIGSTIGLVIGTIAIIANLFSIRRFFKADHKYKWPVSALNTGIIVLLLILMVIDLRDLAG